jgi:CRISPR-associated protein Csa3
MVNITVVFTVGFDTKFQFKTILEQGQKANKFVAIINSDKNEKTISAIDALKKFLLEYLDKSFEVLEVDFSKPEEAFQMLVKYFSNLKEEKVIIDISGGMRVIGVITLISAIVSIEPRRLEILMWTEDLKERLNLSFLSYVTLKVSLSNLALNALRTIIENEGISLTELSKKLGKPKSSVYKAIKELLLNGFIEERKEGRKHLYYANPKGKVISQLSS